MVRGKLHKTVGIVRVLHSVSQTCPIARWNLHHYDMQLHSIIRLSARLGGLESFEEKGPLASVADASLILRLLENLDRSSSPIDIISDLPTIATKCMVAELLRELGSHA